METASLLRSARRAARLTQAELARFSATSQATLSAYENGRKVPSADTLARILAAAGHRLTAEPATRPVVTPTAAQLAARGRILAQVLDLAEALPFRARPRLSYPPLRTIHRATE